MTHTEPIEREATSRRPSPPAKRSLAGNSREPDAFGETNGSPRRALVATTTLWARGTVRNACAVEERLRKPTSEPMARYWQADPFIAEVVAASLGRRYRCVCRG